jgi:general secretion pathway protein A
MYIEYFGLKEEPFNLAPDPRFFYLAEGHKEALARLQFAMEMRKGLIVLSGGVGSGKSSIIKIFIANLKPNQQVALIINPKIIGSKLIQNVCREFGIDLGFNQLSKSDILNLLFEFILKKTFDQQNFSVIIDDAHELTDEQLDDVLLFTKIATNTQQLLQVFLVGLPELLDKLKLPQFLPIYQRIQIQYYLKPFSYSDTQNYIFYRLSKAGLSQSDLFKADAVQRIFQLSRGLPRTITIIASNALLYGYLKGLKKIDYQVVNMATDESLQKNMDSKAAEDHSQLADKFPPQFIESPPVFRPKRQWLKWILISIGLIASFILLNIIALYLIHYFGLF